LFICVRRIDGDLNSKQTMGQNQSQKKNSSQPAISEVNVLVGLKKRHVGENEELCK